MYSAFGSSISVSGSTDNRFRYYGNIGGYYLANARLLALNNNEYDAAIGRYTSRIRNPSLNYDFESNNPVSNTDSNVININDVFLISLLKKAYPESDCGAAELHVRWLITKKVTGWIIQKISRVAKVYDCKGNKIKANNLDGVDFLGAWQVINGLVYSGEKDKDDPNVHQWDKFRTKDEGYCKFGFISIVGYVKFVPGFVLTIPPWKVRKPEDGGFGTGSLPTLQPIPSWWSNAGTKPHALYVGFNCCSKPPAKPIVIGVPS